MAIKERVPGSGITVMVTGVLLPDSASCTVTVAVPAICPLTIIVFWLMLSTTTAGFAGSALKRDQDQFDPSVITRVFFASIADAFSVRVVTAGLEKRSITGGIAGVITTCVIVLS